MSNFPEDSYVKNVEEEAASYQKDWIFLYSTEAANNFGFVVAVKPNGETFNYTAMYIEGNEKEYNWSDNVVVHKGQPSEVRYITRHNGAYNLFESSSLQDKSHDIAQRIIKIRHNCTPQELENSLKPKN